MIYILGGLVLVSAGVGVQLGMKKGKQLQKALLKQLVVVTQTYASCMNYREGKYLQMILIGSAVLSNILFISGLIKRAGRGSILLWLAGCVGLVIGLVGMLWALGYILMSIDSMHQTSTEKRDTSIQLLVLLSYLIESVISMLVIFYGNRINTYYWLFMSLLILSHLLFFCTFIKVINPPLFLQQNKPKSPLPEEETSFGRTVVTALLLLLFVIWGMYLAVSITFICFPESYKDAHSLFDLFYYVVITFATIGYGDIVPLMLQSKLVATVIVISSPIYMILFLGKIVSFK